MWLHFPNNDWVPNYYLYKLNLYKSLSVFRVSYFMANKEFQTNKQSHEGNNYITTGRRHYEYLNTMYDNKVWRRHCPFLCCRLCMFLHYVCLHQNNNKCMCFKCANNLYPWTVTRRGMATDKLLGWSVCDMLWQDMILHDRYYMNLQVKIEMPPPCLYYILNST